MTTEYTRNFALALPDFRTGPWHDWVNGNSNKIDSLIAGAASIVNTGNWANGKAYGVGIIVCDSTNGTTWMCSVAHTSAATGSFAADRAAHPTYWAQIVRGFVPRGEWARNTHYFAYDMAYATNQGILALCKTEHTSNPSGTILNDSAMWMFIIDFHNIGLATALAVTYSNAVSPRLTATNVQNAIDQVEDLIVALDNVNISQQTAITNLQGKDTTHETRMTAIENKNVSQDTAIAGKQASLGFTPVNKAGDQMTGNLKIFCQPSGPAEVQLMGGTTSMHMYMDGANYYMIPGDLTTTLGTKRPVRINLTTGETTLCGSGELLSCGGDLWVEKAGHVHGVLIVDGASTLIGPLNVTGSTTVNALTVNGTTTMTGALGVYNTITSNNRVLGYDLYSQSNVYANYGYITKVGKSGGFGGSVFNFTWTGSAMNGYIDDTLAGPVCDPRVKYDVKPNLFSAVGVLMGVQTVSFKYKDISIFKDDGKDHIGFLADNLEQVLPDAVTGSTTAVTATGEIQPAGLNLIPLVSVLVAAVKELNGRLEALESKSV